MQPARVYLHMTEFACVTAFSAQDAPVRKDARAQSLRHIDHHKIVHSVAMTEPDFSKRTSVCNVVHYYRQASCFFDTRLKPSNWP